MAAAEAAERSSPVANAQSETEERFQVGDGRTLDHGREVAPQARGRPRAHVGQARFMPPVRATRPSTTTILR